MTESPARPTVTKTILPLQMFFSELIGTGLLLLGCLSLVIFVFGAGSPVAQWIPSATARNVMCGFLFGSLGASIALSPVGTYSGAHINPAVTFGFLLAGKLKPRVAFGYVVAQFTPFMIPFLYAFMVPLETAISGTSTNPARSLGPAIISMNFEGWWIYWVGPLIGTVVAILACSFSS